MKSSLSPTPTRPLALSLALGSFVGAMSVSPEARALSCESAVWETLELELSAVELDGHAVELDDPATLDLRWADRLYASEGGVYLGAEEYSARGGESFNLDMAIEPSPEVADYIAESAARRSGGLFCSGLPYDAADPGVYLIETWGDAEGWPEDASLTLDAERSGVVVEFVDEEGVAVMARYEVVDFHFPGDEGGCSVSDDPSPTPWGLALIALLAVARARSRAHATADFAALDPKQALF